MRSPLIGVNTVMAGLLLVGAVAFVATHGLRLGPTEEERESKAFQLGRPARAAAAMLRRDSSRARAHVAEQLADQGRHLDSASDRLLVRLGECDQHLPTCPVAQAAELIVMLRAGLDTANARAMIWRHAYENLHLAYDQLEISFDSTVALSNEAAQHLANLMKERTNRFACVAGIGGSAGSGAGAGGSVSCGVVLARF